MRGGGGRGGPGGPPRAPGSSPPTLHTGRRPSPPQPDPQTPGHERKYCLKVAFPSRGSGGLQRVRLSWLRGSRGREPGSCLGGWCFAEVPAVKALFGGSRRRYLASSAGRHRRREVGWGEARAGLRCPAPQLPSATHTACIWRASRSGGLWGFTASVLFLFLTWRCFCRASTEPRVPEFCRPTNLWRVSSARMVCIVWSICSYWKHWDLRSLLPPFWKCCSLQESSENPRTFKCSGSVFGRNFLQILSGINCDSFLSEERCKMLSWILCAVRFLSLSFTKMGLSPFQKASLPGAWGGGVEGSGGEHPGLGRRRGEGWGEGDLNRLPGSGSAWLTLLCN